MTYVLVLLATLPKSSKGKSQSLASAILKDSYSNSSTLHNDEEDDDISEQESDSIENSVYCTLSPEVVGRVPEVYINLSSLLLVGETDLLFMLKIFLILIMKALIFLRK